jgi:hypothetical protein
MVCHIAIGDAHELVSEHLKMRFSEEVGSTSALVDAFLFHLFFCGQDKFIPFLYVSESLFVVGKFFGCGQFSF